MDEKQFADFLSSWMELNRASMHQISVLPPETGKKIMEAGPLPSDVVLDEIRQKAENINEIKNLYSYKDLNEGKYFCFVKEDGKYRVFVIDNNRDVLYSLDDKLTVAFKDTNGADVPVDINTSKAFIITINN